MTYLGYVTCATMRIRSFSVFVDFCSRNSKLNILKYSVLNDYDVFWWVYHSPYTYGFAISRSYNIEFNRGISPAKNLIMSLKSWRGAHEEASGYEHAHPCPFIWRDCEFDALGQIRPSSKTESMLVGSSIADWYLYDCQKPSSYGSSIALFFATVQTNCVFLFQLDAFRRPWPLLNRYWFPRLSVMRRQMVAEGLVLDVRMKNDEVMNGDQ